MWRRAALLAGRVVVWGLVAAWIADRYGLAGVLILAAFAYQWHLSSRHARSLQRSIADTWEQVVLLRKEFSATQPFKVVPTPKTCYFCREEHAGRACEAQTEAS
jgi:hypothetical protein